MVIGSLLSVLPPAAQLALVVAVTVPSVMIMTRSLIRLDRWPHAVSDAIDNVGPSGVASGSQVARGLTYLGFATLAILTPRPTPTLAFSDWIFLAALVVAVLETAVRSRSDNFWPPTVILAGAALILVGGLVSLPTAVDPNASLAVVARFMYLTVGWFALASFALRNMRDVSLAVQLWIASVALSGAAAVAQLVGGDVIPGTFIANGRMTGFATSPSDLGGVCAVALVPAVMLLDIRGRSPARWIGSAAIAALVATGLLLSGSVDGYIAAAVGLFIWLWTRGAGRRGIGVLVGFALIFVISTEVLVGLGLIPPGDRIAAVFSSPNDPNATLYLRLATFDEAWRWIGASPIVGVGFDPANSTTATGSTVHNMLISAWFEGGIFAFFGIVIVVLAAVGTTWRAWMGSKSIEAQRLAAALLAAFGSSIAFSMGNPMLFQRYLWAPVFLAIALVSQQARENQPTSLTEAAVTGDATLAARLGA